MSTLTDTAPAPAPFDALDDDALVARVLAGEPAAFAALVARHQRSVHRLAYRLLGNAADAEDAAQETFIRAYTRLATYRPAGRFGPWLRAVCAHWCLDQRRARGRRVVTVALGRLPESERFTSPAAGPEDRALARAGDAEARRWLAQLPPPDRAVLALRHLHDLSYREIADALGEPVSTVRMRLFRARRRLQQVVEQERAAQEAEAGLVAQQVSPVSPRPCPQP